MSDEKNTQDPNAVLEEERRLRRRAEETFRELSECHRLLIEGAKDYAILGLDSQGRIVIWNEGARRLLGYEEKEVLGKYFSLTFTAEDRQANRPERELEKASSTGSAVDENWAVRKDGSRFWASGMTTRLPTADPPGFVKIFRDLTERRKTEQALAQSEARLRVALFAARMGTWLLDLENDREHLDDNLRQLLGLPTDAEVNTFDDFLRRVHPDDRAVVAQAFHRCVHEGEGINLEFRVVWSDGSVHWLRDQGNVLRDGAGKAVSLAGACVDITERKIMEEALRQAHDELEKRVAERTAELRQATERAVQAERLAAIGLTVAGLAHEGRNALQAIHASAERLHWRLEENVEALDIVKVIQTAHDTLHRLFEDVRGYSAPIALCYRVCDLGAVWRGAWTQALAQQAGREAHLEEETDGCDLTLEADSFRIDQVFRNVFDNALTACPDPVRVRIRCTAADLAGRPALRLSIRDNGPGLNDEQKRRIFDAFYTTKTHGTGLGMAIAQRIIEAHGGHIEAGSPAGSGAEILIHLPRGRT